MSSLTQPLTVTARPELTGGVRVGVLLSHGFTGSPASMRPWGQHLGSLGYGVRVPLLPGHGTTWQDLNGRRFEDWYGAVSDAYEALRTEHDVVVAGGLSMGGALVLKLAADRGDALAGVMVVNPAVATKRLDVKLLPVLKHVVRRSPRSPTTSRSPASTSRATCAPRCGRSTPSSAAGRGSSRTCRR